MTVNAAPPFAGVRVVEVAEYTFVPAAAMILADLGADVIKIEAPGRGDAQRALAAAGVSPMLGSVNMVMEQTNRGKRSVGINIASAQGKAALFRLLETADVFMTSLRTNARRKLGIDADAVRQRFPRLVYVQGTGFGMHGPDAATGGYDMTAYWARSGLSYCLTSADAPRPVRMRPGMGDRTGAMNLAFGVAAALFRRTQTGTGATVDGSLLATGLWTIASDLIYTRALGRDNTRTAVAGGSPLVNEYRTRDGRWLVLVMLDPERAWPDLCSHLERPDLASDPRFVSNAARRDNREACVNALQDEFAKRDLNEWRERFSTLAGAWSPFQSVEEAASDAQARHNGYIEDVRYENGEQIPHVQCPVRFDDRTPPIRRAPHAWEHTDEVLRALGMSDAMLKSLRDAGDIA